MGHRKERKKILHVPSTHEIFYCLCGMPSYCKILAAQMIEKPYSDFLRWLIANDFYNERTEKISISKMANDCKSESSKVTKWIREIYEGIFELNYDKLELFQEDGLKLTMYIQHYDDDCTISTALSVMPREFETFRFPFV